MMSKAEIQAYRINLDAEMRDYHDVRMRAMDQKQYHVMGEASHKFEIVAARIDTIDNILKD